MAASSYDIDTGCGGVNLLCRDISPEAATDLRYVVSLADGETGRILSLGVRRDEAGLVIITGGRELKIWRLEAGNRGEDVVAGRVLRMFPLTDGGSAASESDLTEDEEDASTLASSAMSGDKKTGFCNCSLM